MVPRALPSLRQPDSSSRAQRACTDSITRVARHACTRNTRNSGNDRWEKHSSSRPRRINDYSRLALGWGLRPGRPCAPTILTAGSQFKTHHACGLHSLRCWRQQEASAATNGLIGIRPETAPQPPRPGIAFSIPYGHSQLSTRSRFLGNMASGRTGTKAVVRCDRSHSQD